MPLTLKIKYLSENAKQPIYSTPGSACFDIHTTNSDTCIQPNSAETFGTGLSFEIPENHVMLVFSRSGHGFSQGLRLANSVGVIDSDYRGELKVRLTNDTDTEQLVSAGSRCAQAMSLPVHQVKFEIVDELSETLRGEGGMGSTGVK